MKVFKIFGFVLLGVISLLGVLAALVYYQYHGKYGVDREKYSHHVGYISPENVIQVVDDFSLCGNEELIGYYHSAAPKIYRGTKHRFREFVLSSFQNKGFDGSGYLNLRFHVNCKGQVGNLEVNQLDDNFHKQSLSIDMVDQIVGLISHAENWDTFAAGDYNYYMYLNFKIENGDITEIIP